jgi:hypothetical protein
MRHKDKKAVEKSGRIAREILRSLFHACSWQFGLEAQSRGALAQQRPEQRNTLSTVAGATTKLRFRGVLSCCSEKPVLGATHRDAPIRAMSPRMSGSTPTAFTSERHAAEQTSDYQEQHQLSDQQPTRQLVPEPQGQEQSEQQTVRCMRPWTVIAEELRQERDPLRIAMLAEELNCALGARRKRGISQTAAH